jgi:fatty-acyl-CoA synthase
MADSTQKGPTGSALLLRAVYRYGDLPALTSADKVITYREMGHFIARTQVALDANGVRRDEFVAILGRNGAEAYLIGQAAQAMGARISNLHPMGSLQDHLGYIEKLRVRHVVIDSRTYLTRGQEIAAAKPDAKIYSLGPADFGPDLLACIEAVGSASVKDLSDPRSIAGCTFTGGTTGAPKLILSSHARTAAFTAAFSANYELPKQPRVLATGPITHVTGSLLLPTFMRGGVIHMLPGFNPDQVVRTISEERINTTLMVPTMIYTLLDSPAMRGADLSSLELALYSASPMSPSRLVEAIDRLGPIFAQLYAQSEIGPITYMPKADHDPARPERFGACGFPVPECEVRLLNDAGEEVAIGESGEICARAAYGFEGYYQNEAATAETLRGGFVHTGDIARSDEQGRLYIIDRKKDMIVSGGFNVYPREVEDAISTLSEVAACAVIGEPHPHWGEAVCAYVILKPGLAMPADVIIQTVKEIKGSVHAPKEVHFVKSLPMTPAGKIDKKPLREKAWAGAARQVN